MKTYGLKKLITSLVVGVAVLSSCTLKPANSDTNNSQAEEKKTSIEAVTTSTSPASSNSEANFNSSNTIITKSSSNIGELNVTTPSSNSEMASNILDLPLPDKDSVSGKALEKYVEGLRGLKSNKADFIWTREDNGASYKGELIMSTLFEEGAPKLLKTVQKSYVNADAEEASDTSIWYKDMEKFMVEEEGKYVAHMTSETEDSGNYDFSGLITKALSFKEATEDDIDYTVSIETDDVLFIKEAMGLLGYIRSGENDWKSDLTMEIIIDKESGYAKSITYSVVHKETKNIDGGNIVFTENNEIEEFTLPNEGDPVEDAAPVDNGEVPQDNQQAEEYSEENTQAE